MAKQLKKLQDLLEEGVQSKILPDQNILNAVINESSVDLEELLSSQDGAKEVQKMLYAVQNVGHQDEPLFLDLLFQCQIQKLIFTALLSESCKSIVKREDVGCIVEQLLDVVNGISELSSSAKGSMVTDFLEHSLDLLTRIDVGFRHRMEALKSTNLLLENCPFSVKEKFMNSDLFLNKLNVVVKQLQSVGDYEFQVGLIECLFRIIPRKQRENFAGHFFPDADFSRGLLQIHDSDFETDCRLFLNGFNNSLGAAKRVLSLPCTSAFLGDKELYKPNEPGYDEFWVDFNLSSQRVTVFCEQESISSQNSADDLWETVTVWMKDLQNFGITRKKNYVVAHLFLLKSVSEIFPSQCDVDGKEVQFHFDQMVDVEDALLKTFGSSYYIKKPEPKVSSVDNPILIHSERKYTEEYSPKQQKQQQFPEMNSGQFSQGTPSLFGRKVSVPCVPMATPRSVSSLKSYHNDYACTSNSTCVNNTSEHRQFTDLDDSYKSSGSFSATPSDIKHFCQHPKNNNEEMLDKEKMNKKKEFQVPKTPKQTRSKVKVKTPVVVINPKAESECCKGRKNKKDNKRYNVNSLDKDLKKKAAVLKQQIQLNTLPNSAEEKDKKKRKDQCDKFMQQEKYFSELNEGKDIDDIISNKNKVLDDIKNGKEVEKRTIQISKVKKELPKSSRNMKNKKVAKPEKNELLSEEEEGDVIIPSSIVEERTSVNQLPIESDSFIDMNLLKNLKGDTVGSNDSDVIISVSDSNTLEINDQLLNRKLESPLSDTKDSYQGSIEKVQEITNDLKSICGSNTSVKNNKELSSSNGNAVSGRKARINKENIFKIKNYDLCSTDAPSLCTASEISVKESTASTRNHYDFPDDKDDAESDVKKAEMRKRTKPSTVKKEERKQPTKNKKTKEKQISEGNISKTLCDFQHDLFTTNDTSCCVNFNSTKEGKLVNEKNVNDMMSTRGKVRGKSRKQVHQTIPEKNVKNHKNSYPIGNHSLKNSAANSPKDQENGVIYVDKFENESKGSECKNIAMNSKYDEVNINKDKHTKKPLQSNKAGCNKAEKIKTKPSDIHINHSSYINEDSKTSENTLPEKFDRVFRDKTNYKFSSEKEKSSKGLISKKKSMQNLKSKINLLRAESFEDPRNEKVVRPVGITYNSEGHKSARSFNRNSVTTVYMTYCATESLKLPSEKGDASKDPYNFDLDCQLSQGYDQLNTSNDKNKISKCKSRVVSKNKSLKTLNNYRETNLSHENNAACVEYQIDTASKCTKKNSVQKNMSYSKDKLSRFEESKRNSKSAVVVSDHELYSRQQHNRSKESQHSEIQSSSKNDSDSSQEENLQFRKDISDVMCNENDSIVAHFSRICQGIVSGADNDKENGSPCNSPENKLRQRNERLEVNDDRNNKEYVANDKLQTTPSKCNEPSTSVKNQYNQFDALVEEKKPRWMSFKSNTKEVSDCEMLNENNIEMITQNLNKKTLNSCLSDLSSTSASSRRKNKRKRKQVNYKENSESDIEELDEEEDINDNHNNPQKMESDRDLSRLEDSRFLNDSRSEVSWILKRSKKKKPEKVYKREKKIKRIYDNSETEESEIERIVPVMPEMTMHYARKSKIDKMKREKSILRTPMTPAGDHIAYIDDEYNFMPVLSLEELTNHCRLEKPNSTIDDIASIRSCMSSLRRPKTPSSMYNCYLEMENVEDQDHVVNGNFLTVQNGFVSGPSTDIRPTKTSLKRKYQDVAFDSEESQKSFDDVEDYIEDEELESSKLIPRKLFKEEIKVLKRTCEEENVSNTSTSDHQTEINFDYVDLPDEEHNATYSGVSNLMNAFSGDIQRQMQAKKHHLETLTKAAVKSTHRAISKSWWDQHDSRQKILHDFDNKLMLEVLALEADIVKVKNAEDETLTFFRKQLHVIQNHRLSQEKRIKNLNELRNSFYANMIEVENATEKQKSLKDVMRKDLVTLQKKLLQESQQQELMNVRKSLQSMLQHS